MVKLNKAQRRALFTVWLRDARETDAYRLEAHRAHFSDRHIRFTEELRSSYREFRRTVQPGPGCVMVPWHGMWLGIEPDGYTHS